MTQEEVLNLARQGETLHVEFKSERSKPLSDRDLIEAVVCLANRQDDEWGYLLVGVEDDGSITGACPRQGGSGIDPHRVEGLIGSRTRPAVACRAELVTVSDQFVLILQVPGTGSPVATSDGRYLRRTLDGRGKPECVPFHYHEMQSRISDRGGS